MKTLLTILAVTSMLAGTWILVMGLGKETIMAVAGALLFSSGLLTLAVTHK